MDSDTTPAAQEPGKKKSGKLKWILGAVAALVIIGAIASAGGDDKDNADTSQSPTQTTAPAADTGRMSSGEFDSYMTWWNEFLHERDQFADAMPKCAAIAGAGQFAEASECIGDAYSGFDTNARLLVDELDKVDDDVAGKCRTAVRGMRTAVEGFSDAMAVAAATGENLQFDQLDAAAKTLGNESKRLTVRQGQLIFECRPE